MSGSAAVNPGNYVLDEPQCEGLLLFLYFGSDEVRAPIDNFNEAHFAFFNIISPGFNFGDIQNVVDYRKQMAAAVVNIVAIFGVSFVL